jgi:hypothetical protein
LHDLERAKAEAFLSRRAIRLATDGVDCAQK